MLICFAELATKKFPKSLPSCSPNHRLIDPPTDLAVDIERVTVRGEHPLNAPESPAKSFMRIAVEPEATR